MANVPTIRRIGFVGCGKITTAVATGFCTPGGWSPSHVVVSPRSERRSTALRQQFPERVTVARSNQEVVDNCDAVFIGLLPDVAEQTLPKLNFRPDQLVVSMMATKSHADMLRLTRQPADRVVISVPLPTTQRRKGPVLMFPNNIAAKQLFSAVGVPVPLSKEDEMKVLLSFTSLISPFYAMLGSCVEWADATGADRSAAETFVGSCFHSLAEEGFLGLAEEAATPGGLNHQSLQALEQAGMMSAIQDACGAIHERIGGVPLNSTQEEVSDDTATPTAAVPDSRVIGSARRSGGFLAESGSIELQVEAAL